MDQLYYITPKKIKINIIQVFLFIIIFVYKFYTILFTPKKNQNKYYTSFYCYFISSFSVYYNICV